MASLMHMGIQGLSEGRSEESTDGSLFGSLGSKHLLLTCGARQKVSDEAGAIARWARIWKDEVDMGRRPDIPEGVTELMTMEWFLRKLLCELVEVFGLPYVTCEAKPVMENIPDAHRVSYWGSHKPFGFIWWEPYICALKRRVTCKAFGKLPDCVKVSTQSGEIEYKCLPNKVREAFECPMGSEDLLLLRAYYYVCYLRHIFSTVSYLRKEGAAKQMCERLGGLREMVEKDFCQRYGWKAE